MFTQIGLAFPKTITGSEDPNNLGETPMTRLYCGIDFHKKTSSIHIVDEQGNHKEKATLATPTLVKFFSNRKNLLIGIEASGGTNDIVQKLKDSGQDVRIINPNMFKAIGIGGKKTDERDAKMLAEALRLNFIPEVYHKTIAARRLKSLIISREMIVRMKVNLINHIRGQLREYGITIAKGPDKFLALGRQAISLLDYEPLQIDLNMYFDHVQLFVKQIAEMEKKIAGELAEDYRFKNLQTIPGVGLMTNAMLISITDDVGRFSSAKHFASYIGIVPREYSSGEKRRLGSITRSGSEVLRRYLIHGARAILMYAGRTNKYDNDPNVQWALNLKKRIGMNKATVALAHRMARTAFAMLRDKTTYGDVVKNNPRPRVLDYQDIAA